MTEPKEAVEPMDAVRKSLLQMNGVFNRFREAPTKQRDLFLGETFARISGEFGKLAAAYLFQAQWRYSEPEWFDHRLHILDPEKYFNDFWTASSDNVISVLPYNGMMLDLCAGDGFYDYWFYRFRASVVCIERNAEVFEFAKQHHSHPRITYICDDVLTCDIPREAFDVVLIRGAIEHFSAADQQRIFQRSYKALKPGGYFCGDTPAKQANGEKALTAHECEWRDEAEMRKVLGQVFEQIETRTLVSAERTTLLWCCRKTRNELPEPYASNPYV